MGKAAEYFLNIAFKNNRQKTPIKRLKKLFTLLFILALLSENACKMYKKAYDRLPNLIWNMSERIVR